MTDTPTEMASIQGACNPTTVAPQVLLVNHFKTLRLPTEVAILNRTHKLK